MPGPPGQPPVGAAPGQLPPGYPVPPGQVGGKPKRWGIPSAVIGLAFFFGGQVVFGLAAVVVWLVAGRSGTPPAIPLALVTLVPTYAAVLGWMFAVSRWKGDGIRAAYALRFKWYDIFLGLGGGLVAMGGVLGGTLLVSELTGADAESAVGATVLGNAAPGPALYVFLVLVAFLGPFVEEVLYRGMVWRALANRMGPVLTLAISSVLFAVVHLEPVRMLGLLLGGAALGGLRLLTNRLAAPLVAHMLLNTVAAGTLFYEIVLK